MENKIEQVTKPTLSTYGKYRAKAVHEFAVDTDQLIDEQAKRRRASPL